MQTDTDADINFQDTWIWSAHVDCESDNYQKSIVLQKTVETYNDLIENLKGFKAVHDGFGQVVKEAQSRLKSYSVFRKGIHPAWEDKHNSAEFRLILPNKTASAIWSILLLEILRDNLFSNVTNGTRILLDRRGNYRMELWMTTMDNKLKNKIEEAINKKLLEIKNQLIEIIQDTNSTNDALAEIQKMTHVTVKYIPKNKLYYVKQ